MLAKSRRASLNPAVRNDSLSQAEVPNTSFMPSAWRCFDVWHINTMLLRQLQLWALPAVCDSLHARSSTVLLFFNMEMLLLGLLTKNSIRMLLGLRAACTEANICTLMRCPNPLIALSAFCFCLTAWPHSRGTKSGAVPTHLSCCCCNLAFLAEAH